MPSNEPTATSTIAVAAIDDDGDDDGDDGDDAQARLNAAAAADGQQNKGKTALIEAPRLRFGLLADTKRNDHISWDELFIGVALLAAQRSKDPCTQVCKLSISPVRSLKRVCRLARSSPT